MIKPAQKNIAEKIKVSYCVMQLPKKQYQQMGNYVDLNRLRPLHVKNYKETFFKKQEQLYTFARVYCNHTIILYNANCSYLYQWPIFNQIQHMYIHIICIVPFYQ